ncbi:hypothetical protein HMPREF9138_00213 [Prevotella histicola F0411]|jgi:hypothetical protein|uniref:Transcriptional repressor n=2 Tax=Prevotella histicola TaxID=470565 RepID=G6ADS0_9BACT|nr:hypothetical protein HMPREF9138_00213 [Prevotella histicola F0411]
MEREEMDEAQIEQLLKAHGVKLTANRIVIIRTLAKQNNPVSMKELELQLQTIDKSSISRTLSLFKDHHLVHQLEDGDDIAKYELCLSHNTKKDEDMHVHFYCESCHRTFCLSDIPVPQVKLPTGYRLHTVNYMIKGICPQCAHHGNVQR